LDRETLRDPLLLELLTGKINVYVTKNMSTQHLGVLGASPGRQEEEEDIKDKS
jgi:hypothetical protein